MTADVVGVVVGPPMIPAVPAALDLADNGEFDVVINDLGFNFAIGDERPYERATAQFRKDQLDTTNQTGDQSLTGLWTRGQFAFHGGAGLRYYDVAGGEEVLNRYASSVGLDPFATLGEVVLDKQFVTVGSISPFQCVPMSGSDSTGAVAAIDGASPARQVLRTGEVTTITTVTTGNPQSLAASAENVFVAVGSRIEKVTGITGAVHVTNGDGNNWAAVWVVKSRLLMVDVAGVWFTAPLSGAGTTVTASANAVWRSPFGGTNWGTGVSEGQQVWHVAETPGAVLIARNENVYSLTIQDDGTLVEIQAPAVAAQLPPGEVIRALACFQGMAVLATSRGVRMAEMSSTQVAYGPLIVRKECQTYAIGYRDGKAWVGTTERVGGYVTPGPVIMISLEAPIADRVWAYAAHSVAGRASFTADSVGGFVRFGWNGVEWMTDDLLESGSVTTGQHRFATLENKKFQSVKVRASGAGGSVDISRVYGDGTEALLHTIVLGEASAIDLDLREDEPMEMLGLKFTLNRSTTDPTVGPVLQGYQLRALPAPQRHRLIKLPLLLYDVERSGARKATGAPGSAWLRLSQLEQMEKSGGTFLYRDNRTKETAEVFIESVEHKGTTPPSERATGFGGVVYITLRMLA